ncbi:Tol-Pal system beta propeller repeat protein TolB [Sandaracinobacteroides saxicola]|nr:Tol-Pal system beta propeller repeat protein TolB [Sandaracinobacteroides saxicola]
MRLLLTLLLVAATPALATLRVDINSGQQAPMPIAVPAFPSAVPTATPAGDTAALGAQVAAIIRANLAGSGLFKPIDPAAFTTTVTPAQVTAPSFLNWRTVAAQALVSGFVTANPDGTLTVGCYLYDVFSEEELARQGFTVTPAGWRRAAHKCSDLVYSRLTGENGYFDSRIVYVSEEGPKTKRIKRLAIMDQDGANHRFLTSGASLVLTPRFAPNQQTITYMSFANNRPRVWLYNVGSGRQEAVGDFASMSFAPRFSPDGGTLYFSVTSSGNADILAYDIASRATRRLTGSSAIDTSPSPSPDGKRIVFESDRGGTQQLYVMNADGSGQQRISFGEGRAASPVWSPRGDLIAFTRIVAGKFRIAVIRPDGSGERLLTDAWQDENPTWAPNGRVILFSRTVQGSGRVQLRSVDLTGVNDRRIATPRDGSDPAWSPLLP